jgi:hypothetical protein
MQTYSANSLAEMLERDRGTVVKSLRNVPPDAVVGKRNEWKISTASRAVEDHLRSSGRAYSSGTGRARGTAGSGSDPRLVEMFERLDEADAAMRAKPTVEQRRDAARAMMPIIAATDKATRAIGLSNGHASDIVNLRSDAILKLQARCIESATGWSHAEVWEMINEVLE